MILQEQQFSDYCPTLTIRNTCFLALLSSSHRRKFHVVIIHWTMNLGGFQFQGSGCCNKSCLLVNLLLVLIPPSRDKHHKVSYPRTLQHDEGVGWTRDLSIQVAVKTGPIITQPRCWQMLNKKNWWTSKLTSIAIATSNNNPSNA